MNGTLRHAQLGGQFSLEDVACGVTRADGIGLLACESRARRRLTHMHPGRVLVGLVGDDAPDRLDTGAVSAGDGTVGQTFTVELADFLGLRASKPNVRMRLSLKRAVATLAVAVGNVIRWRPQKEMCDLAARRVIARVADHHPLGDRAVFQFPGVAVSADRATRVLPEPYRELAVAPWVAAEQPFPAASLRRFGYGSPEAFLVCSCLHSEESTADSGETSLFGGDLRDGRVD